MRTINECYFIYPSTFLAPLAQKQRARPLSQRGPLAGSHQQTVHYGPIEISDVKIHKKSKLAIVHPEETLEGTLHYKIDAGSVNHLPTPSSDWG